LEKFGVWIVYLVTLWLTLFFFTHYDILALLRQPGEGGLPFWLAVDLVVAMPISWMPLVPTTTVSPAMHKVPSGAPSSVSL